MKQVATPMIQKPIEQAAIPKKNASKQNACSHPKKPFLRSLTAILRDYPEPKFRQVHGDVPAPRGQLRKSPQWPRRHDVAQWHERNMGRLLRRWHRRRVNENITVDDIKPIYRTNYLDRCRCQDLLSGVDWAVFESEPDSSKALLSAVGACEDGTVGPQTPLAATNSQPHKSIKRIAVHRDNYYRSLGHFDKFGKGVIPRND